MSFEFSIPMRRVESIFGTGFPSAKFDDFCRLSLIHNLLRSKFDLNGSRYSNDDPKIDVLIKSSRFGDKVIVEISGDLKLAYSKAIAVEKYLWSLPSLGYLSPPRWWNRIIQRRPTDVFFIDTNMIAEVIEWLQENVSHRDYQFISKFKHDITLGFRSEEAATLFKLTFGDRNFISKSAH